jgi:hypothetical protein
MLMKDPKKGMAAIVVARLAGKPKMEAPEMESEMEGPSEYEIAAEEVLAAVESKDAAKLAESLKSFIELCKYSESEDEESEMETE